MVNFGPLEAEILSLVWGTPGNFNGFRVLAALLHGTSSGRQPNCGVEQSAPPIFGRAAITLGMAHISSGFFYLLLLLFFPRLISTVEDWMSNILPHMVWP